MTAIRLVDPGVVPEGGESSRVAGAHPAPRHLFLELVSPRAALRFVPAWSDLIGRALEPNVFLDPGFILPLVQHAGAPRIDFLLVWEEETPTAFSRLLGLVPVAAKRSALRQGLHHPQLTCGLPLLDATAADDVLDAALTYLAKRTSSVGLLLHEIPADGAFAQCLARVAQARGLALAPIAPRTRAVLPRAESTAAEPLSLRSARRRKEHARQKRRLGERGERRYRVVTSPDGVATALELFLALERSGWKGETGSAFLCDARLVTFVRTMMRHLAAEGRCAVHILEVGDRPVAIGLVLRQGDRAYFWKTAYDETLAALSPGVQLAVELTGQQRADRSIVVTDSCAVADHPMIDALWPDRQDVVDLAVAMPGRGRHRFARALALEEARRRLRARVKSIWLRIKATRRRTSEQMPQGVEAVR